MKYMNSFSERLLSCRKTAGLSQKALANIIGVSDAAITMMEKGKRFPSFEILCALADYFNVSLDYLVGRSDTPYMLKAQDVMLLSPDELALLDKLRGLKNE